jgi:hypothetical protein
MQLRSANTLIFKSHIKLSTGYDVVTEYCGLCNLYVSVCSCGYTWICSKEKVSMIIQQFNQ